MRSRTITTRLWLACALWSCGEAASSARADAGDAQPDAPDILTTDAAGTADTPDVRPLDVADGSDAATDDGAGGLGAPGVACTDDAECASRLCVDVVPGDALNGLCSSFCTADRDCPRDFDCVFIQGGGDAQRLCLPVDLCVDADGDAHGIGPGCLGTDCDDVQPLRYLGRDEVCDGLDNDCDEVADDNPIDAGGDCETGFPGECSAGRTACAGGLLGCAQRAGPAPESCDRLDNDCDGAADEDELGAPLSRPCFDGDPALVGIGVCARGLQTCSSGGFSGCAGQRLPAAEVCDGLDQDCDGVADDGLAVTDWYVDRDGDGFGDARAVPEPACARPAGSVENFGDCDDTERTVRPGVAELPGDGVDQNCDGSEFCFEDADGDGVRPASSATVVSVDDDCLDPGEAGATDPTGDCDDDEAGALPGNPELCDGVDNDCNRRADDAAGCYPNGATCLDPVDCASGLCQEGICARLPTCVDLGLCPPRLSTSAGGGGFATGRFVLEVSAAPPATSPPLQTARFRLTVGPGPYLSDP